MKNLKDKDQKSKVDLREQKIGEHASKVVVARASSVATSPRKLRKVADAIRGLKPLKAVDMLAAMPQRAAINVLKVYQQGVGNAKNNFGLSPDKLKVISLQVEEGPRGPKRMDIHSHGARFNRGIRQKRMAHIRLELGEENGGPDGTEN